MSTATALDGAALRYHSIGSGPGLVIVHGTMSSAENHRDLAQALADDFTVHVVDRRGRAGSGPFPTDYSSRVEVGDLAAVVAQTNAEFCFGVSSGGLISLMAAREIPTIRKVGVFEPPLYADVKVAETALRRLDADMAGGRVAAALVGAMKAAEMGPAPMRAMPDWLLERIVNMGLRQQDRRPTNGYISMRSLAPTLHYDFVLVAEAAAKPALFTDIQTEVLLLGGSRSPAYLGRALGTLQRLLTQSKRVQLPGVGHDASWNADLRGHPAEVAAVLRDFFGTARGVQ